MKLSSRKRMKLLGTLLCSFLALVVLLAAVLVVPDFAGASSHREAPLISKDPFADNTDTYAFIPAGQSENIVLAASWIPFEAPEGGPNYWEWDENAFYDIHVDTNGDAAADVTYTLRARTEVRNGSTFLYNTGPIESLDDENWNRPQFYTVTEKLASGEQKVLVGNVLAPPVNIGSKSTPNYKALMQEAIYTYTEDASGDEIKIFAGQTDDPFWVDLQVFDLLTLRGQEPPIGYSEGNNVPVDSLSGYNVHSLVLEIPISRLATEGQPVLGVWATTRRPSTRVLNPGEETYTGEPVQISRLGMPLVNEVVIPMGLKDTFNAISPTVDLTVYDALQKSVEDPEVGNLLCQLYDVPLPADSGGDCSTDFTAGEPRSGRGDIFDIYLRGMVLANEFTITTADGSEVTLPAGFNVNRPEGVTPAEMIRINTSISDTLCSPTPSRLGILGGDACGFPNGRRLTDDVVEISLLAVAGGAYPVLDGSDTSFEFNPSLIDVLSDNVENNDAPFQDSFPYMAMPHSGQEHMHHNALLHTFSPMINKTSEVGKAVTEQARANPAGAAVATGLLGLPVLAWIHRRRKEEDDLLQ